MLVLDLWRQKMLESRFTREGFEVANDIWEPFLPEGVVHHPNTRLDFQCCDDDIGEGDMVSDKVLVLGKVAFEDVQSTERTVNKDLQILPKGLSK